MLKLIELTFEDYQNIKNWYRFMPKRQLTISDKNTFENIENLLQLEIDTKDLVLDNLNQELKHLNCKKNQLCNQHDFLQYAINEFQSKINGFNEKQDIDLLNDLKLKIQILSNDVLQHQKEIQKVDVLAKFLLKKKNSITGEKS